MSRWHGVWCIAACVAWAGCGDDGGGGADNPDPSSNATSNAATSNATSNGTASNGTTSSNTTATSNATAEACAQGLVEPTGCSLEPGADCAGWDGSCADLRGRTLDGINLSGATLRGADLTDAILVEVDLSDADLSQTVQWRARLEQVTLTNAVLDGAVVDHAVYDQVSASGSRWDGVRGWSWDVSEGSLAGATFLNAAFGAARFWSVDLTRSTWEAVTLRGASLLLNDWGRARWTDVDLTLSTALANEFDHLEMEGVRATHCEMIYNTWTSVICPDGTRSEDNDAGNPGLFREEATCIGHFTPTGDILGCRLEADGRCDDADLSGATLYYGRLSGVDLSGADLSGADLAWADLSDADLTGANLSGANLSGANLTDARITGADFTGAYYTNVIGWFEEGREPDGVVPITSDTSLPEASLMGISLGFYATGSSAFSRPPENLNLSGADLSEAGLDWSHLEGVDLSGANLSRSTMAGARWAEINLSGADLFEAVLVSADLIGGDLSDALLNRADVSYTDLHGASLVGADLSKAVMRRAGLLGTDLSGATVDDVMWRHAYYDSATVWPGDVPEGVYFIGADSDLAGADLTGSVLSNAVLTGADLTMADLQGAELKFVDLTGATLTGANLTNADLSGATGLTSEAVADVVWDNTMCPDGTNSEDAGGSCDGHLEYP
ncbi:MAG: hypothetical protein CMH57_14055 [Myxococcales bacterium]|nr:hypothetical protein [Myxococcales bacterium]